MFWIRACGVFARNLEHSGSSFDFKAEMGILDIDLELDQPLMVDWEAMSREEGLKTMAFHSGFFSRVWSFTVVMTGLSVIYRARGLLTLIHELSPSWRGAEVACFSRAYNSVRTCWHGTSLERSSFCKNVLTALVSPDIYFTRMT